MRIPRGYQLGVRLKAGSNVKFNGFKEQVWNRWFLAFFGFNILFHQHPSLKYYVDNPIVGYFELVRFHVYEHGCHSSRQTIISEWKKLGWCRVRWYDVQDSYVKSFECLFKCIWIYIHVHYAHLYLYALMWVYVCIYMNIDSFPHQLL